jgi:hypothetical protein
MDNQRRTTTANSRFAKAGSALNQRSILLRNFVLNGQESAFNPLLQNICKPLAVILKQHCKN